MSIDKANGGTGAYGEVLKTEFRMDSAPALVTRTLRKTPIAVTDCRRDGFDNELSGFLQPQDAYFIVLKIRGFPDCETWENGQHVANVDLPAGITYICDLRKSPQFIIDKPFHSLFFYIPRSALDAIADEVHAPHIGELVCSPSEGYFDGVMRDLGRAMIPALARPDEANSLFVDHVALALSTHVAATYGGLRTIKSPPKGGLAPWQERRAREMLAENLHSDQSLKDIAAAVGLSVSHFSRAFQQSTGLPPHRWQLRFRIELAKRLLDDATRSLVDIALAAGFADQSHFTRAFSSFVGASPGAWRRAREIGFDNDAS
jgi:AraC family transcriptional regulator